MSALIGHDNQRKTVTFGGESDGATEGRYRTARLWARLGTILFTIPAVLLTLISTTMMLDFATDLATTWGQVLKFGAIAIALSLSSTGLLAWAGLIELSHPEEARRMQLAWIGLLGLAAIAMLFFVFRMGGPASPELKDRAAELRARLATLATPAEWDAWNNSAGCASPPVRWRATCNAINARRAKEWAEVRSIETGAGGTWSPATLINTGAVSGVSDFARRLMVGLLTLTAMVGAGVLARWGALGHSVAMREADGLAPITPKATPVTTVAPALSSPLDTASMWFRGNVRRNVNGRLSPTAAYLSYVEACEANALPPIPESSFYNWLAAKCKASDGVERIKSHGKHVYQGWEMGEVDKGELPGEGGEIMSLPYRM